MCYPLNLGFFILTALRIVLIAQRICLIAADVVVVAVTVYHTYGTMKASRAVNIRVTFSETLLHAG